jgi:hypothetical protein
MAEDSEGLAAKVRNMKGASRKLDLASIAQFKRIGEEVFVPADGGDRTAQARSDAMGDPPPTAIALPARELNAAKPVEEGGAGIASERSPHLELVSPRVQPTPSTVSKAVSPTLQSTTEKALLVRLDSALIVQLKVHCIRNAIPLKVAVGSALSKWMREQD